MAEYNIQMNRYVSASDSYDQLFPKTKTIDVVDQNGDNLDTLLGEKIDYDEKGAANGVASLGADGKVPSSQLPATGYSKDETLTAATAALYGLTNTAVPDDVFSWLGKYNTHCWKRISTVYAEQKTNLAVTRAVTNTTTQTISYASSISINGNGEIELVNPLTIDIPKSAEGVNTLVALAPCYITNLYDAGVYYLPSGSNGGASGTVQYNSSIGYVRLNIGVAVTAQTVIAIGTSTIDFVFSTNRSAYPDSGIQDGYEYEYVGVPFDNLPTAPKIETGSYVGTGAYGASNPNSLTFSFKPKFVSIVADTFNTRGGYVWAYGSRRGRTGEGGYFVEQNWGDKSVEYYSSTTDGQLNTAGYTYHYIAIG